MFKLTSFISIDRDPKKITISASNDSVSWEVLHSPELKFVDRQQEIELIFQNEKKYKYYSIQFEKSDDMMYLGKYGLVQAYTKSCTSDLFAGITGELVLPYSTLSPTEMPTNEPTSQPTDPLGHEFTNVDKLRKAAELWVSNQEEALKEFGHMKGWRTGKMTSMHQLFKDFETFNENVSSWDTSNVTDMNGIFNLAKKFNRDLSSWNTAKVRDFMSMFDDAKMFNQDLSTWNTSSCTSIGYMFHYASIFNGDVSSWDTSNVKSMYAMFNNAYEFNADVSGWVTTKVVRMEKLFTNALKFNQDLSSWHISKRTGSRAMSSMFRGCTGFNQTLCWYLSHLGTDGDAHVFGGSEGSINENYPNC